jgi:hypothetical protein
VLERRKAMRRLILAAVAAVALVGAMTVTENRANAMTLPGVAGAPAQTEAVALVCRNVWNGWAWVRNCYRTGPRYYGYGPRYYGGYRGYRGYGGYGGYGYRRW